MEIDKRPFYVWLIVILANVGTYLTIVIMEVYDSGVTVINTLFVPITSEFSIIIGISLFVSIIPIWFSGSSLKWLNRLGYGIPVLLLLPLPYFVYDYYTCTGKFCELGPLVLGWAFGLSAIIFAIFYLIGVYFRKWNVKVTLSLVWIEAILLVGAILFLGYYLYFDLKLASLQQESQETTTPNEIAKTCDSLPDHSRRSTCWNKAIKLYQGVDVCALSKETNYKNDCLRTLGLIYRENREYGCEDQDPQTSGSKKDDPAENARLIQCWQDKAKIYPEFNICQWTYEWNRDKCTDFFKTISR